VGGFVTVLTGTIPATSGLEVVVDDLAAGHDQSDGVERADAALRVAV
jgi:hypothetical protein